VRNNEGVALGWKNYRAFGPKTTLKPANKNGNHHGPTEADPFTVPTSGALLASRVAWPDYLFFHTVSRRGGGGTPVKLPPHWHSPRNHLAGAGTPKESINPARQETQGRCTGSRQARHQPRYLPPGLSDSSVSHKSKSRNTCRERNRLGFHWPRITLPTVARDTWRSRAIQACARPFDFKFSI